MQRSISSASGVLLIALAACQPDVERPTGPSAPRQIQRVVKVREEERAFADMEKRIPGSAGFYFDASNHLVAVVPRGVGEGEARQAIVLSPSMSRVPGLIGTRTQFSTRVADFSFSQLAAWRDIVFDSLLVMRSGVTFLDLDERQNRVVIGVEPSRLASGRPALEQRLLSLGVDLHAVILRSASPIHPHQGMSWAAVATSSPFASLRPSLMSVPADINNSADTIVGGLGIRVGQYQHCTLGFVAQLGATLGYIGSSHCTPRSWEDDGTSITQSYQSQRVIGNESYDPGGYMCGLGKKCRLSDAVFFSASNVPAALGLIARPILGSTQWDTANPYFMVTRNEASALAVGEPLNMVGAGSGWTQGQVTSTCVDFYYTPLDPNENTQVVTCVYGGDYHTDYGDTGAPLFQLDLMNEVNLVGSYFANDSTGTEHYFAGYWRINQMMGENLIATRPATLATPSISGSLYQTYPYPNPVISWSAIPGATYYWVYRRACDLDGDCDFDFGQYEMTDGSPYYGDLDVTQYLGTTTPGPKIRKWVGYYVRALGPYDVSGYSQKIYFKRP